MTYLSDRHRREYIYALRLIQLTFFGAIDTDDETKQKAHKICENALIELLPHDERKQAQLLRNVNRAINVTLRNYANKAPQDLAGEKVVLATYCLLELLGGCGALNLVAGSPLVALIEFMLSNIDANNELTQKRLKNAQKDANKWLANLREIGYYV